MSVGDKIVKQPYEFGNAYKAPSNPLVISQISIPYYSTIVVIMEYVKQSTNSTPQGNMLTTYLDDTIYDSVIGADGSYIRLSIKDNIISPYSPRQMVVGGGILMYVLCLKDNSYFKLANKLFSLYNIVDRTTRNKLVMQGVYPINDIMIFDRELSNSEQIYLYNNGLFNDLQSTLGLIHRFRFNNADIVNIDQVESIGTRDIINNGVCLFSNLPAGTLQQKVDYANANLFVPFQQ